MKKRVKLVFDRKGSVAKTGYGKVEICISLQGDKRKYETVATATPEDWETTALNKNVVAKMKHYEQILNAMMLFGEELTIDQFNNHIYAAESKKTEKVDSKYMYKETDQRLSFIDYMQDYLDKEGLREGSRRNIQVVIDSLKESKIIKTFYDLTSSNIQKYEEFLHDQGDKKQSTICNYHKKIHKYTKILWRSEMIPNDPYNQFEIKHGSSKERQPLTEDELLKLRNATNLSDKLSRVSDLFIFMSYTGLAYVDMCQFDFKMFLHRQRHHPCGQEISSLLCGP